MLERVGLFEPWIQHTVRVKIIRSVGSTKGFVDRHAGILPKPMHNKGIVLACMLAEPWQHGGRITVASSTRWSEGVHFARKVAQERCLRVVATKDLRGDALLAKGFRKAHDGFDDTSRRGIAGIDRVEDSHAAVMRGVERISGFPKPSR